MKQVHCACMWSKRPRPPDLSSVHISCSGNTPSPTCLPPNFCLWTGLQLSWDHSISSKAQSQQEFATSYWRISSMLFSKIKFNHSENDNILFSRSYSDKTIHFCSYHRTYTAHKHNSLSEPEKAKQPQLKHWRNFRAAPSTNVNSEKNGWADVKIRQGGGHVRLQVCKEGRKQRVAVNWSYKCKV